MLAAALRPQGDQMTHASPSSCRCIQWRRRSLYAAPLLSAGGQGPRAAAEDRRAESPREQTPRPLQGRRLLVGPRFVDAAAGRTYGALLVAADGRILAPFDAPPAPDPDTELLRLPGALAVPGLHDAHVHLAWLGRLDDQVDLRDAVSPADVRARLVAWRDAHPDAPAITGVGWNEARFADPRLPTWRDLEGLTDRPVLLVRADGHAVWINRPLMERAGLCAALPDPPGGRVERDPDGEPTGVLVDAALNLVAHHLPEPSDDDLERWIVAGAQRMAAAGCTSVHDMATSLRALAALERLARRGALPVRVFAYLDAVEAGVPEWLAAHPGPSTLGPRLSVQGIKLFCDGALGSRGAAMLDDYQDRPGERGLLLHAPATLAEHVRRAHALGYQAAVHAIGDRGNRVALEAIAHAQGDDVTRRHRLEHAQVVAAEDVARMAALGLVASMQPIHATSDMAWAGQRLGPERSRGAYAWRTLASGGVPLAFGSDAPIETESVAAGLHAAMTRQRPGGEPPGGWFGGERLTFAEALAAYTRGAAWAVHAEARLGSLRADALCDLTLWTVDPGVDPEAWLRATVAGRVLGGALA